MMLRFIGFSPLLSAALLHYRGFRSMGGGQFDTHTFSAAG
jgi:hypothetical protein